MYTLTDQRLELVIGRAEDCHIRVDDEYASPHHALLVIYPDGRVTVADLGSTNGTWVGLAGSLAKVYGPTVVDPRFTVRVGRTDLAVVDLLRAAARISLTRRERSQDD